MDQEERIQQYVQELRDDLVKRLEVESLSGMCITSSCFLRYYADGHLVVYSMDGDTSRMGDHHCVVLQDGSTWDLVCADWPMPPEDSAPGTAYRVTEKSPHAEWPMREANEEDLEISDNFADDDLGDDWREDLWI